MTSTPSSSDVPPEPPSGSESPEESAGPASTPTSQPSDVSLGGDVHQHPEIDEISDYTEDLLPSPRSEQVRAHLACCQPCEETRSALTEISLALGDLPEPPPMPSDIADRINVALAAEPAPGEITDSPVSRETPGVTQQITSEGHTPSSTADAPSLSSELPGTTTSDDFAVSRETAPTPETDALAPRRSAADRPAGRPRGSTGPGRPTRRSRRRWSVILTSAGALALLGLGGALMATLNSSPVPEAASDAPDAAADEVNHDAALEREVRSLLSNGSGREASQPSEDIDTRQSSPAEDNHEGSTRLAAAPQCVLDGAGRSDTPLAFERNASHGDDTGFLLVLPHRPSGEGQKVDDRRVDAYLISACTDPGAPGKLLVKRTFDRR
ncbi:hypothetical protein E0L36_18680 [Streptomyces sp. AJS327]|uniref:anti-sigma factor family protein n=1 Tax=Streptomyces sp. AJS327 TaxID=2545265 RepID=UPI0015DE1744|nr:hypothetical protein [Streptomyces sp. AJS327]MBA0052825.1 hypothetical protein [Streptomyces sp. AJS327]